MDELRAALGIMAVVTTVEELPLPFDVHPAVLRAMRVGLAAGATAVIVRRGPVQRLVLVAGGVWGASELLGLTYSVLLAGAHSLLIRVTQLQRRRR